MTLATASPRQVYSTTGTGPFAIPFYFSSNSHVKVKRLATSGTETMLVEGTDYTISGTGTSGQVTLTTGLTSGQKLAVYREQSISQETALGVGAQYRSPIIEQALDRRTQVEQELNERVGRALRFPPTDPTTMTAELPTATQRANKIMAFDNEGRIVPLDPADAADWGAGEDLGVRSIATGGTGGSTAAQARENLGIGAIGEKDALAAGDISDAHDDIDHRPIIRAYNQAYSTEAQQDLGLYVVESATTTTLPGTVPANGTAYLLPAGAPSNANKIAIVESGAWAYKTAAKGWRVLARDLDTEWYFDGTAWAQTSGSGSASPSASVATNTDGRVVAFAITNMHGGARYRAHFTADQRIVIYGDQSALGFDPVGDSWNGFVVSWDRASNGNIVKMFAGQNYLLILTDQATGNLYHMGLTDHGQGGRGATSGTTLVPTRITQFVTDAVKISHVWTEAALINTEKFWFALTTAGNVYSCGRGANNTQGNNATTDLSTPRRMTLSDGVTALANVVEITCSTIHAPVWARLSTGEAFRWGAGTDGAHGNNNTTNMGWPAKLETTPGSGTPRTDIAKIAGVGSSQAATRAVTWLLTTAGKIESAGSRHYGNGDGAALASAASNTFQAASGAIAALTVTSIYAGGGEYYTGVAITSTGQGYMVGYMASFALLGGGSTTNLNTWTILSGLPSGFAGALTGARIAGGNTSTAVYLEATISSLKYLASIGYDVVYNTSKGTASIAAAFQTWGRLNGSPGAVSSWQSVGEHTVYGVEVLDADGVLWYAGGNDQGQGGTHFGNLRSVAYLQPCIPALQRTQKTFTPEGAYSGATTYQPQDVVTFNGSSWVCLVETTGNAPPSSPSTIANTWWQLVGGKGDDGADGEDGLSLNWRGPWVTATSYALRDRVSSVVSGKVQSYICKLAHTSGASTEPGIGASQHTAWDLDGQAGNDGAPGSNTGVWINAAASPYNAATGNTGAANLAAIQAALDAANAAGGGIVFLPDGVFNVSNTLQMYSDVELCGVGDGTVLRYPAGDLAGKSIAGITSYSAIAMVACTDARVRNLMVDQLTNANTSNGIVIGGHGASSRSSRCVVEGCTVAGYASHQYLIWNANADDNLITGNYCYAGASIPGTDTPGIEIHGGSGNTVENNKIQYCNPGIAVIQEAAVSGGDLIDNVVRNNRISSCGNGIHATNTASRTLRNLAITGNRISNVSNRGIDVGLSASGTLQNLLIAGNLFYNNPTHVAIDGNGATVTATDSVVISGNVMRSGASGVTLTYAPGVTVRGNIIRNTSGAAIPMDRADRARIVGNTIDAPGGSGIESYTSTDVVIEGNMLLDLAGLAIKSEDSGNSTWLVTRNLFERASGSSASNFVVALTSSNWTCVGNDGRNPPSVWYDIAAGGYSDKTTNYSVPSATLNDISLPAGNFIRCNGVPGSCVLNGITGGVDGRVIQIYNNTSGQTITVQANNAGSTAANRFSLGPNSSVAISEFQVGTFRYSDTDARWMLVSVTTVAGGGSGDVAGPASSTSGNLPSFGNTTGKLLQDSGIAAANVVTLAGTQTLTNKTLTSPALTGTPTAPTAAANTNTTQVATTAFVQTQITTQIATLNVSVHRGAIDCSANPNYPAAERGDVYRVSVAGKIGGASGPNVESGDMLICNVDSSASGNHATVGGNWSIVQANLDGAVIGPASATAGSFARYSGTTGKLLQDGMPAGIANDNVLTAKNSANSGEFARFTADGIEGRTAAELRQDAGIGEVIVIPISDETTNITTGTAKVTFRMPFAMTLTSVRASLTVASTSGTPTIDINEGGTSILSTKITIDANEKTSTTAATAPVLSDTALADDAEITIDIDVAGTDAKGLKVYLIGQRT